LCVGPEGQPDQWIEVRLGDFNAPELSEAGGQRAKRLLVSVVLGRALVCRAGRRTYDRVVGYCTLGGTPLGALLRARGGVEGGR
jgi:endonuclease YncB( thermonuclease family)